MADMVACRPSAIVLSGLKPEQEAAIEAYAWGARRGVTLFSFALEMRTTAPAGKHTFL